MKITTLLFTLALLVACGKGPAPTPEPIPDPCAVDPASCLPPPVPVDCGPGLAATDLAGNCRATPQATMGALEAVP